MKVASGPSAKTLRKEKVWEQTQTCIQKYSKCMFVNVDNVTSKQICIMRKSFREIGAVMVMGKNVCNTPFCNFVYLDPHEDRHQRTH